MVELAEIKEISITERVRRWFSFREKPLKQRQLEEVLPILTEQRSKLESEDERKIWDYLQGQLAKVVKGEKEGFSLLIVPEAAGLFFSRRPYRVSIAKVVPPAVLLIFLETLGVSWTDQERALFEQPLPFGKSEALSEIGEEEKSIPLEKIKGLKLQFLTAEAAEETRVITAEVSF